MRRTAAIIAALVTALLFDFDVCVSRRSTPAAGLESPWQVDIEASALQSEYHIRWQNATGAYQSPNRSQNLRVTYFDDGFRLTPRVGSTGEWDVELRLESIGKDNAALLKPGPVREAQREVRDGCLEVAHEGFTMVYENGPMGMRQDFVVDRRPPGAGLLTVALRCAGSLRPVAKNSRDVVFVDAADGRDGMVWYKGLKAWDANGNKLSARVHVDEERVCLQVDDRNATYPVTVDPLSTTADWSAESNQAGARFGVRVAPAGDVNGDGYDDVFVGADLYDNGQTDEGAAFVYHGGPSGLSASPDWMVDSDDPSSLFGNDGKSAGDVNGDGYDDVIIGAHQYGDSYRGAAFLYLGSASGLQATAAWSVTGALSDSRLGFVAGAGDVNNDGYGDVIVGEPDYGNDQGSEGRILVFYGSVTGLPGAADWTFESDQTSALLGYSVDCAGDVNGDGYDDVIAGAHAYDNGSSNEGRAYVFLGGPAGLASSPVWTAESDAYSAYFGRRVAGAGDVNADGYDDLVVGAYNLDRAYVYHGTAGGVSSTPAEVLSGGDRFGFGVGRAGDVNGDGYDDLVVGAYYYGNGQSREGQVCIYYGSDTGVAATAEWTYESDQANAYLGESVYGAGDVNGDNVADIVIGMRGYDNSESDEGGALVFYGVSDGPATPVLKTPVDSASAVPTSGTLVWYTVPLATSYRLQLSYTDDFASPIVDQNAIADTFYTLSSGVADTTYFWRVQSTDGADTSLWSMVWSFSTYTTTPDQVTLVSPASNETDVSLTPTLVWNSAYRAAAYNLVVSANADLSSPGVDASGLADTTIELDSLGGDTRYYWRVCATNDHGAGTWSVTDSFTTVFVPPAQAVLLSPSDGAAAIDTAGLLSWRTTPGATTYELQVASSAAFMSPVMDLSGLTDTTRTMTGLTTNTLYHWRVRAVNAAGSGDWSATWEFTTAVYVPPAPVQVSPTHLAVDQNIIAQLAWHPAGGDEYAVVAWYYDTMWHDIRDTVTDTVCELHGLDYGVEYRWKVSAGNSAGYGDWSPTWYFTTRELDTVFPPSVQWDWYYGTADSGQHLGLALVGGGDVDGDGREDVVAGSRGYSGHAYDGCAMLFPGTDTFTTHAPDTALKGFPRGTSIAMLGDMDVDGHDELVVGYPDNGVWAPTWYCQWIYCSCEHLNQVPYGGVQIIDANESGQLASIWYGKGAIEADCAFETIVSEDYGRSLSTLGDVDGDRAPDLAVGAGPTPGDKVVIFLSDSRPWSYDGNQTLELTQEGTLFGHAIGGGGDVNGDGFPDLVVGAPAYDSNYTDEGMAALFAGTGAGLTSEPVWRAVSGQASCSHGESVLMLGDVNGDGYADVAIGAPGWDGPESDEGLVSVYYGGTTWPSAIADWVFQADEPGAHLGAALATADVNGDGYADLLIGAPGFVSGSDTVGKAYLFVGGPSGFGSSPDWTAEGKHNGVDFGATLAGAGDLNGDGCDEIAIGALNYGAHDEGRVFMYYGAPNDGWFGPDLISPAPADTSQPQVVTLVWRTSAGAVSYQVQACDDGLFTTFLLDSAGVADTTCVLDKLPFRQWFHWRVRVMSATDTSAWSAVWRSRVLSPPTAPSAVVLTSPSSGSVGHSSPVSLTWLHSDTVAACTVQVSTRYAFDTLVFEEADVTDTTCSVDGLDDNTAYFWRVRGTNVRGAAPWSETWVFGTGAPPVPEAPASSAPQDLGRVQGPSVVFRWLESAHGTSYHLQVATDPGFASTVVDQAGLVDTMYAASGLSDDTYYWRVNTTNGIDTSGWSDTWMVVVCDVSLLPTVSGDITSDTTWSDTVWVGGDVTVLPPATLSIHPGTRVCFLGNYRIDIDDGSLYAVGTPSDSIHFIAAGEAPYWAGIRNSQPPTGSSLTLRYCTLERAVQAVAMSGAQGTAEGPISISDCRFSHNAPAVTISGDFGADTLQLVRCRFESNTAAALSVGSMAVTGTIVNVTGAVLVSNCEFVGNSNSGNGGAVVVGNTHGAGLYDGGVWLSGCLFAHNSSGGRGGAIAAGGSDWEQRLVRVSNCTLYGNSAVDSGETLFQFYENDGTGGLSVTNSIVWDTGGCLSYAIRHTYLDYPVGEWDRDTSTTIGGTYCCLRGGGSGAGIVTDYPMFADTANDDFSLLSGSACIDAGMPDTTGLNLPRLDLGGNLRIFNTRLDIGAHEYRTPGVPDIPLLVSPSDMAVGIAVDATVNWQTSPTASSYELQLSSLSDFSSLLLDTAGLPDTSLALGPQQLDYSSVHYWRVRARNPDGASDWSTEWSFTTSNPPPPVAPVLVAPSDGASGQPIAPVMRWRQSSGADSYSLQLSLVSDFSSLLVDECSLTDTAFVTSGLSYDTPYYWRVSATNVGGTSAWSPAWGFTTQDEESTPVPATTPATLAMLVLLLCGAGGWALRWRTV